MSKALKHPVAQPVATYGASTKRCISLEIAPELRGRSDREVLIDAEGPVDPKKRPTRIALAQMCDQIHGESIKMFYAENKFVLTYTSTDIDGLPTWSPLVRSNPGLNPRLIIQVQLDK